MLMVAGTSISSSTFPRPLQVETHGTAAVHFQDQLFALRHRNVRAEETLTGLWNLPAFIFFHGVRRDAQRDSDGQPRAEGKRGINWAVPSLRDDEF